MQTVWLSDSVFNFTFGVIQPASLVRNSPTNPQHLGRSIEVVFSLVASIPLTFPTCLLHGWRRRKYCHAPERLQAVSITHLWKVSIKTETHIFPTIRIVVGWTENTAQGLIKKALLRVESRYSSVDNSDISFHSPPIACHSSLRLFQHSEGWQPYQQTRVS